MYVVVHNMQALNAQRQFGINAKSKMRSTEKLSSGYKINRSADDASGLAISEKMRRQIRGLRQGTDNIQEGISMVQVAEGALGEITECLQRINELSIKAYNDTNQRSDREYIQSEVKHLIAEIDRIADTTTYNEMELLKGNPTHMIEVGKFGYITTTYETQIPDWLKVSPTLEPTNSAGLAAEVQDGSKNAIFQTAPGQYTYYGPQNSEYDSKYTYGGEWSETLTDNASAIIDFNGLYDNVQSAEDLYQRLFGLIGTSIGVPCGTCTEYYGISFAGSESGLEVKEGITYYSDGSPASATYINLSNWKMFESEDMSVFEKVMDMMKTHAGDDSKSDAAKAAEATSLATEIAEKLSEESFERISRTMNNQQHFDKVLKTSDNRIVIYDYRDTAALQDASQVDSKVQVETKVRARVPSVFLEGEFLEQESALWIQCSAQADDEIFFDLPFVDAGNLGIENYSVASYKEKTVYSEEYQKKVDEWMLNGCHYETRTVTLPAVPASTKTVLRPKYDYNEVGEYLQSGWKEETVTIAALPERTITERVLVQDTPKPVPGKNDIRKEWIYAPDDVKLIADALDYVSRCRADLGATQNRLEHSYRNNENKWENTSAAESEIRDTDMAKEMVKFSRENILEQVGHAIMAQANQSNQGVLSLIG